MTEFYSRRSFLKGALVGSAALAAGGLAGCASEGSAAPAGAANASYTFADTIAWDATYDVVVIGFGGAGASATIYAADEGAKVLLCDVAPEGHEGGNTRYCAQISAAGDDAERLLTYYKSLSWKMDYDEEVLRVYTQGMTEIADMFRYIGIENPVEHKPGSRLHKLGVFPEYPEAEAGDAIGGVTATEKTFNSALWKQLRQAVMDRHDKVSVWLESPAQHLVQDPDTKTVVGVEIDKQGEKVLVRAVNGVVLACGGFENNRQMQQDYLGVARLAPLGTTYNKGDGVRMSLEVGADLWHMNCYESLGILSGNTWRVEEGQQAMLEHSSLPDSRAMTVNSGAYGSGSIMLVAEDGSRFLREDAHTRHGHTYYCGVYRIPTPVAEPYLVFDEAQLTDLREAGFMTEEKEARLVKASSVEELADKIGANPDILTKTVSDFNFFASKGVDYAFGREAETLRPFDGSVYYAAPFGPVILNTQGGPRRNASSEVVGPTGQPIPHLYSAGECGGVTSFHYNGGGNIAECLIFGRLAGQQAAAKKDDLPSLALPEKTDPKNTYSIGTGDYDPGAVSEVTLKEGEFLGTSAEGIGGEIQVKVTVDGDTIANIEVLKHSETPDIGGAALEELPGMVVAANSTDIDAISGATITSNAFKAAVEEALSQA